MTKISLRTWGALLLLVTLAVAGCADRAPQSIANLDQKAGASQTSSARAYPATQNMASSRLAGAGVTGQTLSQAALAQTARVPSHQVLSGKVRAAIFLPLSGAHAELGQAMLNAAQQAVFDAADGNFLLLPQDTAGPGGADTAARAALNGGVDVVIGPLFATDIPAVRSVMTASGVSMLALSTDTSLAEPGVYVMGLSPAQQAERVVAFAFHRGARRFAALVPATPYGSLVGRAFKDEVARLGGAVVGYETLGADAESNLRAIQSAQPDALFLPEGGDMLKTVAAHITSAGIDTGKTRLLGTGLWDVEALAQQAPALQGAWYAAPDPAARRNFVAGYESAFGKEPPRLATLAYDATALVAVLARRGAGYDAASMTNPNGFAGLDGIFRLLPNGDVERALAVNEVVTSGAKTVDPAPSSFVGNRAMTR